MSNDIKSIKAEAEEAIEEILRDLEEEGIRVFRLLVFTCLLYTSPSPQD